MATLKDTIKFDGYDQMSDAEKIAAWEAAELPKPDYTGYISKEQFDKKTSELSSANKRIKALEDANLSDTERLENERKAFEAEKAQFARDKNATLIQGIFAKGGLKPEDYADFDLAVYDDAEQATKFANSIVKMVQSQRSTAEQGVRNTILGGKAKPESGATVTETQNLQQRYIEAVKSGNTLEQARVIRQAQEKGVSLSY